MKKDFRLTPEQLDRLFAKMHRMGYNETSLSITAGFGRTYLHDVKRGKSKSPGIDGVVNLCKVLGMSLAELLEGKEAPAIKVPIIGEITNGDIWHEYNTGKRLPELIDLWSSKEDLIAVRVLENSMSPRYQRGDIVLGNRVLSENADNYIGLHCIIATKDEQTFLKVLTRGSKPKTYTLRSLDPSTDDIHDVELSWFAPIVSILPRRE